MILDRDLKFIYANQPYMKATHRTMEDLSGRYVFDVFPDEPDRVNTVKALFDETLNGVVTEMDAQPFQLELEDGTFRQMVWRATQDPLLDGDGGVVGLIQRAEDITKQFELEQRNKAISYELNHRVKNIMAVIASIARITGRRSTDVPSFVTSFTARLNSISRTHDQLADNNWVGLNIRTVLESELDAYLEDECAEITMDGPDRPLSVEATKDFSMVIHELATNGAKYGCFGKNGGHLHLEWTVKDETLCLIWDETCRSPISPPEEGRTGFGSSLIMLLPYVDVTRTYKPDGLRLELVMSGDNVFED